mmetsp:Transcript_146729/g.365913  ORF Transcript_146729/g.365913 Transcript_146729/m.365913 type:complete len:300 (+) Transcript_146729:70-969(+)
MRHVTLVGSLSLVAAWGLRWRLAAPRGVRTFAGASLRGFSGAPPRALWGAAAAAAQSQRRGAASNVGRRAADPCSVLGLAPGTRDESEVRAAFRKLAKMYHPDVPGTGDADRFQAVQEAAQQLLEAGGALGQGASLDSIFNWSPTGSVSRTASGARAPPSSAARPLEQDAFAASRGLRVDVKACAARRKKGLRKTGKVTAITHAASPETVQRIQGVLSRTLGVPAEALNPSMPLEGVGIGLEQGCVGFQHVADFFMGVEEEFDIEIVRILVGTWMKLEMPPEVQTIQGFADFVESKVHA